MAQGDRTRLKLIKGGAETFADEDVRVELVGPDDARHPHHVPQPTYPRDPAGKEQIALNIANAVMHAAMCWVMTFLEREGTAVDVSPLGNGLYDATVHFPQGDALWLRLNFALQNHRMLVEITPFQPEM